MLSTLKKKLKMNTKCIVIVILVIVLIGLASFTYYLYSEGTKCKAIATDLGTRLQECGAGVDQLKAGLNECMAGAQACQTLLIGLTQIPECAPYIQ